MQTASQKEAVVIEEVTSIEGLIAVKDEWESLFNSLPDATPFQSPEWLVPWWRNIGGGQLLTLCLRTGGKLTGLAPLYSCGDEILFLGTGISDYLDILLEPGAEEAGCQAVFRYLSGTQTWRRCDLHEIKETSKTLSQSLPQGLEAAVEDAEPCLYLDLPDTVEEFMLNRSSRGKSGSRRLRRKLEKNGSLKFEAAAEINLPEFIDFFFSLHERRWKSQGMPGVLQGPEIRAFHEEAAAGLLAKGMLRLFRLHLCGKPIAALYAFVRNSCMYTYLSGYDPEFSELGPGKLVLSYAVEDAINSGLRTVDFLRGDESYKYAWKPFVKRNKRLILERHSNEKW